MLLIDEIRTHLGVGMNIYHWEGDQGGSLEKSVDYVVPYALGKKTREEWANSLSS